MIRLPRLLFVGPSRCGKDEAGEFLAKVSRLKFAGTTSKYLCKYVAKELGVSEEQAYRERHANRMIWFRLGNRLRENDPGFLIKKALQHGQIIGGIRDTAEIEWSLQHRDLIDLIIWVDNPRSAKDDTLQFGSDYADIIIPNRTTLSDYHERLIALAKTIGVLKKDYMSFLNHIQCSQLGQS